MISLWLRTWFRVWRFLVKILVFGKMDPGIWNISVGDATLKVRDASQQSMPLDARTCTAVRSNNNCSRGLRPERESPSSRKLMKRSSAISYPLGPAPQKIHISSCIPAEDIRTLGAGGGDWRAIQTGQILEDAKGSQRRWGSSRASMR
jgi:hypothetical protein